MHRALERLDGAAAQLVPLLYLAGLSLGTLAYFTDLRPAAGLWIVGAALAFAAELHSFLEQRHCRRLHAAHSHATDPATREHLARQFRAHLAILAALVTFSAFNSIAYTASTWTPAPGWLPAWLQVGIRGGIIPALFLLAGFLSPLSEAAGDLLARASRDMLARTIKATVRQWRGRVELARRRGVDLAPVAIALMEDAGDADGARRIRMIADGLAAAERGDGEATTGAITQAVPAAPALALPPPALAGAGVPAQADPRSESSPLPAATTAPTDAPGDAPATPPKPPTGPGTPAASKRKGSKRRIGQPKRAAVLQLVPEGEADAEQRIRALLAAEPGLSVRQISDRAQVSSGTASKWRRVIRAELERQAVAQ